MLNWERLPSKCPMPVDGRPVADVCAVYRTRVPGGWLVRVEMHNGVSVVFYPDSRHQWDGGSLEPTADDADDGVGRVDEDSEHHKDTDE